MFEAGFLGTRAPFFMDMITIFFALMPFLVAFSIYQAIKKRYQLHFQSQMAIFVMTMVIGIGVDYGIHLLHRWEECGGDRESIISTSKAITVAALTTMVGLPGFDCV